MTRKHFELLLADALRAERPMSNWDGNKLVQWNLDVKAVAEACRSANPAFDETGFYLACGGRFRTEDGSLL